MEDKIPIINLDEWKCLQNLETFGDLNTSILRFLKTLSKYDLSNVVSTT